MDKKFSENEYESLLNFTLELYKLEDMRTVLSLIVDFTVKLIKADRSTLYLLDDKTNELYSEFYHGTPEKKIKLSLDDSTVAGYCGTHKINVNIPDAYGDIDRIYKGLTFDDSFDKRNKYRTRSILCVPLINSENRLLGVLSLLNSSSDQGFSKKDESLLELIACHTVISVTRLQRQELAKIFSEVEQGNLSGNQELFVVFFDIIEFTRLSEVLGDEKIKKFIQAWEEDHIRLINSYGGIYVKSVGDEIMSLFGINPLDKGPGLDSDFFGIKPEKKITLETFINYKKTTSNHVNLRTFIQYFLNWYENNKSTLNKSTVNRAKKFKQLLWAENVIRFMDMAQKNMNWLNNFLFAKKILAEEKSHRVFMKGGAEFGSVIVDFDYYGRIDVIGDVVNVASRITEKGNKPSIVAGVAEQPLMMGPNLNRLLPEKTFVNKTKNYIRLKGKEAPLYIYSIASIDSFENRSLILKSRFNRYKKFVLNQIYELDQIKQKILPFNYASYKIEENDRYLVDHSKRVAVNCLHIIDLMNKKYEKNPSVGDIQIADAQKKTTVIAALLHDIGKHSLNDQVKAYMDPTKSIQRLSKEEKQVFNRLISSFGCSILESITNLRPFANLVKCCFLYFNDIYSDQENTDYPSEEKIPIESRIITLANAIDSILSDTPFREKLNLEKLIHIFESDAKMTEDRCLAQKFDPSIVSLVIEYYQKMLRKPGRYLNETLG